MTKKMFTPIILSTLFIFTCFCFTGCGTNRNNNNVDETPNVNNTTNNALDTTANDNMNNTATDNNLNGTTNNGHTTENVGEAIVNGAEDVVEDLTHIDFTDYTSSHDYLLDKIAGTEGNKNNRYVVKEESKEAVNYLPDDTSRKGYRYYVYDITSDSDEKYGVFYVDHETGKIYRENKTTKKVEEYKGY